MDRTWGKLYVALEKDNDDTVVVPLISQLRPHELLRSAPFGYTVLHLAAEKGRTTVVKVLLEKVPEEGLVRTTWDHCTALHLAAEHCHEETLLLLVERMSEEALQMRDTRRRTALHWVAEHGLLAAARALVHALPPEALLLADELNNTPLHCCSRQESASVLLFLASHVPPMGLLARGEIGHTVLHTAAESGEGTVTAFLLALVPHEGLLVQDNYGCTALHYAANSTPAALGALVDFMTPEELAIKDTGGSTALHLAASEGRLPMVERLVAAMGPGGLAVQNDRGGTALHVAAQSGQAQTVTWLRKHLSASVLAIRDNSGRLGTEYECEDANIAWGELSLENAQRNLSIAAEDLCYRLRVVVALAEDNHAHLRCITAAIEQTTRDFLLLADRRDNLDEATRLAPGLPRPAQLRALQSPGISPRGGRSTPRRLMAARRSPPTPLRAAPVPTSPRQRRSLSQQVPGALSPLLQETSPLTHSQHELFPPTRLDYTGEVLSSSPSGEREKTCSPTQRPSRHPSQSQNEPQVISSDDETESDSEDGAGMAEAHSLSLSRQMARIATDPWALQRTSRRKRMADNFSQPKTAPTSTKGDRRRCGDTQRPSRNSSSRSNSRGGQSERSNGEKISLHKQIARITEDPSVVGKRKRREVDRSSSYLGASDFHQPPSRKRSRRTGLRG